MRCQNPKLATPGKTPQYSSKAKLEVKEAAPTRPASAMSGTKALLKGINEAIKQQKWDEAIEAAEDVFQKDPKNYHA